MSEYKITPSLEDYLEAIYRLESAEGSARITDIATMLSVSKPSVNRAINTLKDQGYLLHEKYGMLKLTDKGIKTASEVDERHKLIKHFLAEILKVDPETAEIDACKIEHTLSPKTMEKLKHFIENFKE